MPIIWQDAYTATKTTLNEVKRNLGKSCVIKTHGRIVYKNRYYTVVEQSYVDSEKTGDYFIIPTALIGGHMPCKKKRRRRRRRKR